MQNGSKVPLIVGVVAVIAIAGGALLFFNNSSDDTKSTSSQSEMKKDETMEQKKTASTIVDVAAGDAQFSTLVAAVKAADLATTLSDTSKEYTVFAPTNDAFAKLPAGTVDTLLLPENKATLAGILTYHVVAGKVLSSQLTDGQVVQTVNGGSLTVNIADGVVTLTDAKGGKATVAKADVMADNGVIHVIDSVVMPN